MKIVVTLDVDKEKILNESGQSDIEDAISQELNWLHDSGMTVDSWEFAEKVTALEEPKDESRKEKVLSLYDRMMAIPDDTEADIASFMVGITRGLEQARFEPLSIEETLTTGQALFYTWLDIEDLYKSAAIDGFVDLYINGCKTFISINEQGKSTYEPLTAEQCQYLLKEGNPEVIGLLLTFKVDEYLPFEQENRESHSQLRELLDRQSAPASLDSLIHEAKDASTKQQTSSVWLEKGDEQGR